jgi:hypothetical protein
MEPDFIKTILYRREPKMATLPFSSQILIGTTCSVFLRRLLEGSSNSAAQVTLKGLSRLVSSDLPLPDFLSEALFTCRVKRPVQDLDEFRPVFTSCPKKTRGAASTQKQGVAMPIEPATRKIGPVEVLIKDAISVHNKDSSSLAMGRGGLIVEDDNDYD